MTHVSPATLIGSVGVALLLLAFLLNLLGILRAEDYSYSLMNLAGASLACYSSYLIDFMPFVVLEGTWVVVAAVALARTMRVLRCARDRRNGKEIRRGRA